MTTSLSYNLIDGEVVFNSEITYHTSSVMIDSTHICVSYPDGGNSYYGTSIIGTINGNAITFSNPYVFNNSGFTAYISSTMIDSTHVMISYMDQGNSSYGTSIIGTIDGDVITWGSEYIFNGSTYEISSVMIDSSHVIVSYRDYDNANFGTSRIGTINGSVITWGSEYIFDYNYAAYISSVMIDSTHVCISYKDLNGYGNAVVGVISGTTLSFGNNYVFNADTSEYISSTMIDATHVCVSYRGKSPDYGASIIGTIDGDVISFGSEYIFNSELTLYISTTLLDSMHVIVNYRDQGNADYGTSIIGTVDGDVITWGSEYIFNTGYTDGISSTMIDSTHICISYVDTGNSGYGTSIIGIYDNGEVIIPENPYIRPDTITGLYSIVSSNKGNLRGKAAEGFIRPTICQFFTSKDFEEIESQVTYGGRLIHTVDNPSDYSTGYDDYFGHSVSISESYVAVAANQEGPSFIGRGYIFDSEGTLLHTLDNPLATQTRFGWSIAVNETYTIIGAYGAYSYKGAAYVFSNTTGNLVHTLIGSAASDNFGRDVSICESYIIVGCHGHDDGVINTNTGKAYIYDPDTGNLIHTLENPNTYGTINDDTFGLSVATCESYSAVSANGEDAEGNINSGIAYLFDNSTGNLLHTLNNPNTYPSEGDSFGYSIDICESYTVVGSPWEDAAGGSSSGVACIFDNATGELLHTLINPNPDGVATNDRFGHGVAINEAFTIVGSNVESEDGSAAGKAYAYDNISGDLLFTIDNPAVHGIAAADQFGFSVEICDTKTIVSAHVASDESGDKSGKAYIFSNDLKPIE